MEKTNKELKQLQRQVEDMYTKLQTAGGTFAEEVMEDMDGEAQATIAKLRAKLSDAREKLADAGRKADDYAHENPWQVMAGGVVAGLVIGFLMGRGKK